MENKLTDALIRHIKDKQSKRCKENIFLVTDNSFAMDIDFKHAIPGKDMYTPSPEFRIIGSVLIPVNNLTYKGDVVLLDTAIQDTQTNEVFYVNKEISLTQK